MTTKKLPPIHPGEILLEEYLKPAGLSMNQLAHDLDVDAGRIAQICGGKRSITGETALRLARYWDTTAEYWMGMQMDYDLEIARDRFAQIVDKEVAVRSRNETSVA